MNQTNESRNPTDGRIAIQWFAALGIAFLGILAVSYVGFQASDDARYLEGALGWIEHFPFVGDSHWTLRHTITIPTAVFIQFLGLNEFATSLTNVLYFIAFLALNAWCVARYVNVLAAWFCTALLIVLPGFTVVATYLNSDIPELFFTSTAFWIIVYAREHPEKWRPWALAGLLLGAAFITRQTAAAAVIFVAVLFFVSPRVPRWWYVICGVAFVFTVSLDWLYLYVQTGNPMYRFSVDFNHDRVDRFAEVARLASSGELIDKEGNLSINVYIDPFLALFVSQKYVLTFWLFVAAAIGLWHRSKQRTEVLLLACGLSAIYFVFVAFNPKLYLVPRYFVVVAWTGCIVVAWWLAQLFSERKKPMAIALAAVATLAAFASLSIENSNPRFVERQLLAWVMSHPGETIYTDPETKVRSEFYFRFAAIPMDSVKTDRPIQGARIFYSADRVEKCATLPKCRDHAGDFKLTNNWTLLESIEAPPRLIGQIFKVLHLGALLPDQIRRRVMTPGGQASIYLVEKGE